MSLRIEAAERMAEFAREGRLIQNAWHGERNGRELACLLGAIGPGVFDPSDCPAEVMPAWLAHLLLTLFDGVRSERSVEFGLRFAEALRAKPVGDAVRDLWLARVVEFARDVAADAEAYAAAAADAEAYAAADAAEAARAARAADAAADAARAADAAADAAEYAAYAKAAYAAANARANAFGTMFNWLIEEMEP
jgi:hypothetical protein